MTTITELADEVRMLELEEKKIGLEKRIAQLKAEPIIDGGCIGCAGPCSDRIKERLKAEEGEVARLRFIITRENGEAAGLQKELDACRKLALNESRRVQCDTELIEKLHTEIESREAELFDLKNAVPDNFWSVVTEKDSMIRRQRKLIEELKDPQTEVDRLRGIICNEHEYNNDLLEIIRLKCHKIVALEAELSARKEDSAVLEKVVDIIKDGSVGNNKAANLIADVVGYYDAPEVPPETPIDEAQEITVTLVYLELP